MRSSAGRRPTGLLPPRHAHDLGCVVQWDNAVDLAVRMKMILPTIHVLAVHVHGRDAKISGLRGRKADLCSTVFGTVGLVYSNPALIVLYTLLYEGGEVIVDGRSWAVLSIESCFEFSSWSSTHKLLRCNGSIWVT